MRRHVPMPTLVDHVEPPPVRPTPPRVRARKSPAWWTSEGFMYIRHPGKGDKVQLRPWLPGWGSVNLGLYPTKELAKKVWARWLAEMQGHPDTPLGCWEALQEALKAFAGEEWDLPECLPKWVEVVPGGFAATGTFRKVSLSFPGPYRTPQAAHMEVVTAIEAMRARTRRVRRAVWEEPAVA